MTAQKEKEEDVMPADSGSSPIWIRVCAWCGISLPGGDATPEPAGNSLLVTHGICPGCRDEFIRAVAEERAAARVAGSPTSEA